MELGEGKCWSRDGAEANHPLVGIKHEAAREYLYDLVEGCWSGGDVGGEERRKGVEGRGGGGGRMENRRLGKNDVSGKGTRKDEERKPEAEKNAMGERKKIKRE